MAEDSATALPEVLVTGNAIKEGYTTSIVSAATKMPTPVLETPMAVQSVSSEVIDDRQITSIQEAVKNVSGVQTPTSVFYDSYMIRGFSTGANTFRNGLKTYGVTGTEDMAFVDRVEIAKGPTAMLYGRVQPGGLVNIVTKSPKADPAYSVQQQLGSYSAFRTVGDATGAVNSSKTLLYRVMAVYDKGKSFVDFNQHENKALAAYLAWQPSTRFIANMQYEYYDNKVAITRHMDNRVCLI
jgi:iron complex outermembrane receptor protein